MTNFISKIGQTIANAIALIAHGTRGRRTDIDVTIGEIEELQVKLCDKQAKA